MDDPSFAPAKEPEIKYLVEKLCEAYEDGLVIWNSRVDGLLVGGGQDVRAAKELKNILVEGPAELGEVYRRYYRQAGRHFAIGDEDVRSRLEQLLHILTVGVVEVLQFAHDDALSGIPCLPSSFDQYQAINFFMLRKRASKVQAASISALQDLFDRISAWAIPLHTLPPLASPPASTSAPDSDHDESFIGRLRSPFHRQRYVYDKLPSQYSIRLVKISAARPYVMCDIETFQLTDPPPFQALSYCWGKGGQHSDIWCNERLFKVSKNLKKGLQRLYTLESKVKRFWIDQICINQSDFGERTEQVRLMRAIYQRASNTVIWAGIDDGSARDAFALVVDLYQRNLKRRSKESHFRSGSVDLPQEDDKRWTSLSQFLDHAWFERCWIIQEVVVSQADPLLLCGHYQVLWSRFQEAMLWIARYHARFRVDRMRLLHGIFDLSSSNDVWELQSLLHSTRAFQATDARDKIFALFGLAGESRSPDTWPKALMPNYGRSTRDVYTEVTLYCIQKTNTLSVLSQVERSPSSSDDPDGPTYPSWVPRWNIPQLASSLHVYEVVETASRWKMLTEKYHRASKDIPVSLDRHSLPGVLRLEGIRVSSVESCLPVVSSDESSQSGSTILPNSPGHATLLRRIPEWYELAQAHLDHLSPNDFMRTFLLATTVGLTPEQTDARQEPLDHIRAFLTSMSTSTTPNAEAANSSIYSLRTAFKSSLSISTLTPSLSPPTSTDSLPERPHLRFRTHSTRSASSAHSEPSYFPQAHAEPARYSSALTPLLHRRLFFTSCGRLGLGPEGMMSGDVVVVLFGGKVPFVLRRVYEARDGEQWRLVGECYVDGVMFGEVLDRRDGDGDEEGEMEEKGWGSEWFEMI